jgi:hypothetical protein
MKRRCTKAAKRNRKLWLMTVDEGMECLNWKILFHNKI